VLLASCSSQQAAAWVLAVPAVLQQLQQQAFQLCGAAEAHGALWELLISTSSSSTSAFNASSASSTAGQCGQVLQLLELDCSIASNLQRQVALLQLLADVQQAAGSRQQVWGPEVVAALKQVAAKIKVLQASTAAAAAAAAAAGGAQDSQQEAQQGVTKGRTASGGADAEATEQVFAVNGVKAAAPGSSSSSMRESADDDADGKGAKAVRRLQQQLSDDTGGGAVDALGQRQRHQLQPAALKLIKQLLSTGGKTD
jgi:hypothetical protein